MFVDRLTFRRGWRDGFLVPLVKMVQAAVYRGLKLSESEDDNHPSCFNG